MSEQDVTHSQSSLPDTSSEVVRQRWLDLLHWSDSHRRVTQQDLEPGVHVLIVPATCRNEAHRDLLEREIRLASEQVPGMARGVRFELQRLGLFALTPAKDYQGWMGTWGRGIAAGETRVAVFVDFAYLEAAVLARLWDHQVIVELNSPVSLFRRGALTDYANVYDAVTAMIVEGRSLADTAEQLAAEVLRRLQCYASVYLRLTSLFSEVGWQIEGDNFVVSLPDSAQTLSLQYWELRDDCPEGQKVIGDWTRRIEKLLRDADSGPDLESFTSSAA